MSQMRERIGRLAPLVLPLFLALMLVYLLIGMGRALGQADAVQPAEPWMPTPDFTRAPSKEHPVQLALWPPNMAGQQPLRSLAIQFDDSTLSSTPALLEFRHADNSSSQFLITRSDIRDNDYVTFPMNGKTPVSATLSSRDSTIGVIGVSGPDIDTATCAIYELMDGTKLHPFGCS